MTRAPLASKPALAHASASARSGAGRDATIRLGAESAREGFAAVSLDLLLQIPGLR